MQILRVVSTFLGENTYLVLPSGHKQMLVVDPGLGVSARIEQVCKELGASVGAILITHAHPDHCWDAAAVEDMAGGELPVYVPQPDIYRIEDPVATIGMPGGDQAFSQKAIGSWVKPRNVEPLPGEFLTGDFQIVEGLVLRALPVPGHTQGSTIYLGYGQIVDNAQNLGLEDKALPFMFSGDVIFAGSVGRTDLAGGDHEQMSQSIRVLKQVIDPQTVILPGHGPSTSWHKELISNPYIA